MPCGVYKVGMNTVQPITIVPFIHWLGRLYVSLIVSHVYWRLEMKRPGTSPCPKLHFVVGIGAARVEDNSLSRLHINSDVLLPQVAMYQGRLDVSSFRLQHS